MIRAKRIIWLISITQGHRETQVVVSMHPCDPCKEDHLVDIDNARTQRDALVDQAKADLRLWERFAPTSIMKGSPSPNKGRNLTILLTSLGLLLLCSNRKAAVKNSIPAKYRRTDQEIPPWPMAAELGAKSGRHSTNYNLTIQSPTSATSIIRAQRRRRQQQKRQTKRSVYHPTKLTVPLPVFVPSLPKSGTTSIHKYFLCGGRNSAHHVYRINGKVRNKIGRCWKQNIRRGRPPLEGCGDHEIWSDTGTCVFASKAVRRPDGAGFFFLTI